MQNWIEINGVNKPEWNKNETNKNEGLACCRAVRGQQMIAECPTISTQGALRPKKLAGSKTVPIISPTRSNLYPRGLRFFEKILLSLVPIASAFVSSALGQSGSRPPNIIIILADDLGYGDVSYNRINPDFLTPNIDSLTVNGVQCTNGYVTHPFCSPSRAALLTGRYQQRFGHENQPSGAVGDNTNPGLGLPLTEVILPQLLKPGSYVCGMIGKWHLGTAPSLFPNQRGFDYFYGFLGSSTNYYGDRMMQNGTLANAPGPDPYCTSPNGPYLTDLFTQQAVSFINSNAAQPFFLYLTYNAPHTPYQTPPPCYMNQVASITDSNRQTYAAMVTALDFGVGQVLQALHANNLLSNTLIFFLSDNGAPQPPPALNYTQPSNYPLRGWKSTLWEGGIRVPFAIQWTGTLPSNAIYTQPVSSLDIVATAAAAAGVSLPNDRIYDGINLLPSLAGQQVSPQRMLFWRWFGLGPSGPVGSGQTIYAVRSGDLKLGVPDAYAPVKLFNLANDIGETTNLSTSQPSNVASLQQSWNQWNAQMIEPLWAATVGWEPSSLVLAGDWNSFQIQNVPSPWKLTRVSAPGLQGSPDGYLWYTTTIHAASDGSGDTTPGMHSFVLLANQSYQNQWGGVTINIDDITSVPFFSSSLLGPANTITFQDGFYYSFRILDQADGPSTRRVLAVMKTSAPPVSVSFGGQTPTGPASSETVIVNIATSEPPSPQEQIYLRWSTDTFVTSNMVLATPAGDGIHYSAVIPSQPAGTGVEYCIVTSTVDLMQISGSGIIDSLTLSTSQHSHYVVAPGATPTATPSSTPTPTSPPMAVPPPTPVLNGLTYNGGTAFVNGTNLIAQNTYTITAQASTDTQSVVFAKDGVVVSTVSAAPFSFTFTAPATAGAHTLTVTPWSWLKGTGTRGASITVNYNVVNAPSPTPTPTPTPTDTPSPTPTPTASPTPSDTPTPTPTPTPTATVTPTPTATPTPTPSPTLQITVQTNPGGRSFTVDGATYTSTQTFSWVSGSSHTIATTSPQAGGTGIQYVWKSWSDNGTISHTVTPTTNKTYTANFTAQFYLTMSAGSGGTVSLSSGWRNSGTAVSISATATNNTSVSYGFSGWTGSGAGSYSGTNNPASIVMNGPITETAAFTQNPVQVTVQTNPANLSFTVDGTSYTATQTFLWQPGSSHSISTTSPQSGGTGIQYVWTSWSDFGAISHTVTPTTNKTYNANFTKQYYLTMSAGAGGTISPGSGWRNAGSSVPISATPTNNTQVSYAFNGWTGTGTGSYSGTNSSAPITMSGPITETAAFTQNPISVIVQTSPAGLSFTVDGTAYTASQTFSWAPGSSHSISTTSPQSGGTGIQFVWSSWSDGGAMSRTVAPTGNKTYTATFTKQ